MYEPVGLKNLSGCVGTGEVVGDVFTLPMVTIVDPGNKLLEKN